MRTTWVKMPTLKLFKDLPINESFVKKEEFDENPGYCDVYIKLNNHTKDNTIYLDAVCVRCTVSKEEEIVPVYIEEVKLEVQG